MKHTYRVRIQPSRYYGLLQVPPLTHESLVAAIEGVVVHELSRDEHGNNFVNVELQRSSHEEALNEILVAVQQLGYSWLEASVTEWTDHAVGGFFFGSLGGGSAGVSTGEGAVGLFLTVLGAITGAVIGSFIESVKIVYEVQWTGFGWQLVQVHPAPSPAFGAQPGLA